MSSNPYAKKFGASAREQKRQNDADLYSFDPSAAANDLIAATIGASNASNGGGNSFGYSNDAGYMGASGGPLASQARQGTGMAGGSGEMMRPMTSASGAGYQSVSKKNSSGGPGGVFDPLGQGASHGPAPPLQQRSQDSPEHAAKDMEKAVHKLIEASAFATQAKNPSLALEKAKEAGKLERALCKHREKNGLADQINFDLTYAVCFNLANAYASAKMYAEALGAYALVVKNKQYPQAGRLRVNMGNIYYIQKKYPAAIKMYRMAMDQIGSLSRDMRFKMMRNIGVSFVRLGQFQDAIHSFEAIMDQMPDAQTAFNLLICYYALGEREKMRKGFLSLINVPEFLQQSREDEEELEAELALQTLMKKTVANGGVAQQKQPTNIVVDELRNERKQRRKVTTRYIHMAARLIAPVIEKDLASGFDWVIQHLKAPRGGLDASVDRSSTSVKQGFPHIAMELEISKGITFLKTRSIREAIEVFKGFEKSDNGSSEDGVLDQAATNLSFLYFLEGDLNSAEKYADLAVRTDRYNAKALVNKANYLFMRGDLDASKELYLEAIGVEADCVEAIYNLGLANKKLGQWKDALQAFRKLHRIIPKDTQVVWHMANLHELLGDNAEAVQLFTTLHGMVPSDSKVLARLGTLYTKDDDETQAFHNFQDSFQAYPVNMEVISWLGVWYVKSGLYEDAILYFQRAAEIEPHEVKWSLMVASCYRRMNDMKQALILYKKIHKQDPENVECLRYLCTITKDHNERDYEEYSKLLKKAERAVQLAKEGMIQHQQQQQGGGASYMRGEPTQAEYRGEDDGARAPDVSPGSTQRHLANPYQQQQHYQQQQAQQQQRQVANLADGYRPELSPQKQGPTFSVGQGGADEWGDGLGDELLP